MGSQILLCAENGLLPNFIIRKEECEGKIPYLWYGEMHLMEASLIKNVSSFMEIYLLLV
jgi:hypothetical protein